MVGLFRRQPAHHRVHRVAAADPQPVARLHLGEGPLLDAAVRGRDPRDRRRQGAGQRPGHVALGQRRAAAAKRYLVDQGIAADRIDVVSFGEERPAAMGSGEESWAKNRRAEFGVVR